MRPHEEVLDEVYLRYAHSNPFLPITHFIDHSTMGAEALVGLGLGYKVMDWTLHHRVRPYEPPSIGISISATWKQALGRPECHGDWLNHIEAELHASSYQEVLARWVPRFAHEIGVFLFHGLIRTAHSVRALEHIDTPVRRGELARGLALWAIGVKAPLLEESSSRGSDLNPHLEFVNYARMGAATFINVPTILNLHLVTGPMAYLLIAHHLDSTVHRLASASFAKTHFKAIQDFESLKDGAAPEPIPSFERSHLEVLASRNDPHPIKLTEAALRAYEDSGDESFLKAAGKARNFTAMRVLGSRAKSLLGKRSA